MPTVVRSRQLGATINRQMIIGHIAVAIINDRQNEGKMVSPQREFFFSSPLGLFNIILGIFFLLPHLSLDWVTLMSSVVIATR